MEARSCRACGVPVAVGYARCPRCRAPLEDGEAGGPARARRVSGAPGGTAVEPPQTKRWIWVAALGAVAAGAGVAFAVAGAGPRSAAPEEAPAPLVVEPRPVEPRVVEPAERRPVTTAQQPTSVSGDAVGGLRSALGKARVFAQISPNGERLELRSGACGDGQLVALVDEAASALRQSGFRRVRCLEPHGQVVFERDL